MLHPASNEVGMDLIRHQDHAVLPANLRHADQLIRRPYPAYRIFRGAENENLVSLLRTDLLEPLPIHLIVPYRGLEQQVQQYRLYHHQRSLDQDELDFLPDPPELRYLYSL